MIQQSLIAMKWTIRDSSLRRHRCVEELTLSNTTSASSSTVTTIASATATSTSSIPTSIRRQRSPRPLSNTFSSVVSGHRLSYRHRVLQQRLAQKSDRADVRGRPMPGILALLQMLGQAGYTPTGATVENAQDFWVPLTQGFYIKASFGEDPENIVSNLQLVLSSDSLAGKTGSNRVC